VESVIGLVTKCGIAPHAGSGGGRMGSDRNYKQISYRIQHEIPKLELPKGKILIAGSI
jgi:hypothetical protein